MRLVDCIIGGAVLCGSFFIALWLIEPEARPQQSQDQRISHDIDLATAAQNVGLVRNRERIDLIWVMVLGECLVSNLHGVPARPFPLPRFAVF